MRPNISFVNGNRIRPGLILSLERIWMMTDLRNVRIIWMTMDNPHAIDAVWNAASPIHGWLDDHEGQALWEWTRMTKLDVLEVGSWKGRSSTYLGAAVQSTKQYRHAFCVDHFKGSREHESMFGKDIWTFPEFMENMIRLELLGWVIPITVTSQEAVRGWNRPLGLVFIDGGHDADLVKIDVEAWEPHLAVGGVIAFHDAGMAGVDAGTDYIESTGRYRREPNRGHIWNAVKLA